jgi:hypothetical protein
LLLGQRDPELLGCCIVGGCGACWRFILWLATVGRWDVSGVSLGNKDVNLEASPHQEEDVDFQ